MPTMNESIYETHTQLFTPQFYNNIKTLTEVRKMQKYGGHSRLTKSEFDKYLMILFTMMISGKERGSVQDNWSKNTKIRILTKTVVQLRQKRYGHKRYVQKKYLQKNELMLDSPVPLLGFAQLYRSNQH
ncbi:Hypothetical_protein [Hexamita inflata]|uniref:Hypothetical_protein n=1 Tax=Hexamita inflata TaxID=28002 RepID=A0AA86TYA1_9EUKA|nr:Hypothetical protein HINF_LOCUS19262 [Hexamita inflata]